MTPEQIRNSWDDDEGPARQEPARPATHSPEQAENGSPATGDAAGAREARYAESIGVALATTWALDEGAHEDLTRATTRAVLAVADSELAELRAEVEQKEMLLRSMDHFAEVAETCERKSNEWAVRAEAAEDALRSLRERIEALAERPHNHGSADCAVCGLQNDLASLASSPAATTGEARPGPLQELATRGWPSAPVSSGEAGTGEACTSSGVPCDCTIDCEGKPIPAPVVAPSGEGGEGR